MHLVYRFAQLILVVSLAVGLVVVALVIGASRPEAASEIATEALASPEARSDVASEMADDLRASAPILDGLPGLDGLLLKMIESPAISPVASEWVEQGIRARLGHDVAPVVVDARDIGAVDPVVALGLAALGPIEVVPTTGTAERATDVAVLAGPGLLAVAAVSYLLVRRGRGRPQAALTSAVAGILAAGILLALPVSAQLGGALASIVVSALVVPEVGVVIAGVSSIVAIRAMLARGGRAPYRPAGISRLDGGTVDLGFDM